MDVPHVLLARSVAQFGARAERLAPQILERLVQQTRRCDAENEDALLECLKKIHRRPATLVSQHGRDPELRQRIINRLWLSPYQP